MSLFYGLPGALFLFRLTNPEPSLSNLSRTATFSPTIPLATSFPAMSFPKSARLLLSLFSFATAQAQSPKPRVYFADIDNFWVAYDSLRTTPDSIRQVQYLQRLYIAKGTPGLRAFMQVKGYTAGEWVSSIRRHPRFWQSIRPNTQLVKTSARGLEPYLAKFRQLYPALRPAAIYFTIGALRSGGTTQDSLVLIGAELATGNPQTDISEFTPTEKAFLTRAYARKPAEHLVLVNVHEYVHTQEKGSGETLLAQALYEGVCDLVAELVTGQVPALPYMAYGPAHEPALKAKFKADMFYPYYANWFYNQQSLDPSHVPDLGYYMGYAICKSYYRRAKNKPQALKEMIELDFTSETAVEAFLRKTRYYSEALDKAQLLRAYEQHQPRVTGTVPATNTPLDPATTELRITFSTPMDTPIHNEYGPGGKDQFPIVGRVGWAADKLSYTYKVALQPGHTYNFILYGGGFRALDGHPLKDYEVKFTTK